MKDMDLDCVRKVEVSDGPCLKWEDEGWVGRVQQHKNEIKAVKELAKDIKVSAHVPKPPSTGLIVL